MEAFGSCFPPPSGTIEVVAVWPPGMPGRNDPSDRTADTDAAEMTPTSLTDFQTGQVSGGKNDRSSDILCFWTKEGPCFDTRREEVMGVGGRRGGGGGLLTLELGRGICSAGDFQIGPMTITLHNHFFWRNGRNG